MLKPNPAVAAMAPYALPDITAADGVDAIVLAQNEHPYPPSPAVIAALEQAMENVRMYSDSECSALREAIAEVHGLDADGIVCGAGSMELMSGLMLSYLSPRGRLSMSEYGYLFMRTLGKLVGASVDVAAENDYRVDVDALLATLRPETRLVFVVNPGNPSGTVIHNDEIRRLRAALPDDVLLLVDEAYAEFVDPGFHRPLFDLAESGNTVITRTFSKVYGLAGLRVGWGYFPAEIREQLRKVINPGSVTSLSQAAARAAMLERAHLEQTLQAIVEQRALLTAALERLGLRVLPSQTNFILVEFGSEQRAASAFRFLRERGPVVRPMAGYGLPACLRITIGTPGQMQLTAGALGDWRDAEAG